MSAPNRPDRLLVIGPSWVGDAVMATPALRLIHQAWPQTQIDLLTKPPVDTLLAGWPVLSAINADRPKSLGERFTLVHTTRKHQYQAALLLSNAFGSALTASLAGIPIRVGYARDGRSALLTHRLIAPTRPGSTSLRPLWAPIPAVEYYIDAACSLLGRDCPDPLPAPRLELTLTDHDRSEADRVLASAGIDPHEPLAILNPGGNNPAKRWPADRFAKLAEYLARSHHLRVLINGSPGEATLTRMIADASGATDLASHRGSIPALKALLAQARLLVTNDTGPRHIAAAFGTPVVTLFGPTDHRWTTIPTMSLADGSPSEAILLADPDLPDDQLANDHPERCRIDHIPVQSVIDASDRLLGAGGLCPTEPSSC